MAPPQPGTPAYLQQAYDLSYLSQKYGSAQTGGSDQTVAVVVAYDDPNAESDLAVYRTKFDLPPCTTGNGCFKKLSPPGPPRFALNDNHTAVLNQWRFETSVDLQAISAVCPNCRIVLSEATSYFSQDLANAQIRVASATPTPTVISDSFGAPLVSATGLNGDAYFGNKAWWTFNGVATVAASGDAGYPANDRPGNTNDLCSGTNQTTPCNEYPAALSGITAAGGTSLAPASGARGFGESAWSGAGSGCNQGLTTPKPAWQASIACQGRAYSDISADADPNTGILIYDSSPVGTNADPLNWTTAGGTSASAPMVAAYYALIASSQGSGLNATLQSSRWPYDHVGELNDPSTGSNLAQGLSQPCLMAPLFVCNAEVGYDGPTGVGSISGAAVAGAPGIGGPEFPVQNSVGVYTYTQSVTSTTAQLQGGVYPNGSATTYWWEYGTTTNYGQATVHFAAGSGTAAVRVTGALSDLAPGTTYHYRLVAQNQFGTGPMYGYDFTFTTAVAPNAGGNGGSVGATQPPPTAGSPTNPNGSSSNPARGSSTSHAPITRPIAPSAGKPQIAALAATTATVTATITPHNSSASYYLAYGTSSKLGHRTPASSTASAHTANWQVRGLKAGKVYYLQVVAANGGGTRRSSMIRIRTSPVTISKVTRSGSRLMVTLRCIGTATCRGRLTAKAAARPIATGTFTIHGSHRATVPLRVNRAAAAKASHGKPVTASVSAVSSYNGYAATVNAKFRLIASS